jgi:hypothetical protein
MRLIACPLGCRLARFLLEPRSLTPPLEALKKAIEQLEAQGTFRAALQQVEVVYPLGRVAGNREPMARSRLLRARSCLGIGSTDATD